MWIVGLKERQNARVQHSFDLVQTLDVASRNVSAAVLVAQQDLVFWSGVMGVVATISLFVTTIGVWFLRDTLIETRKAVKQTTVANEAMLKQNELTERAQRPWLYVAKAVYRDDGFIDIPFKNIGRMPAHGFTKEVVVSYDPSPFVLEKENSPDMMAGTSLYPDQTETLRLAGPKENFKKRTLFLRITASYLLPDGTIERFDEILGLNEDRVFQKYTKEALIKETIDRQNSNGNDPNTPVWVLGG